MNNAIGASPGGLTNHETPQVNNQYNSRRTAAIDSSNKIMVVRSSDG